jgi:deoxyuridine 5'-triphosphate nucleotidohydrolase
MVLYACCLAEKMKTNFKEFAHISNYRCNYNMMHSNISIDHALQLLKTHGKVSSPFNTDETTVELRVDKEVADELSRMTSTPHTYDNSTMVVKGSHALDFMYALNPTHPLMLEWLIYNVKYFQRNLPQCKVFTTRSDAVIPSKVRVSDVGYDLTIVGVHKQVGTNTCLYDTGIRLEMPQGVYAEVIPRSSLVKSGYMLTNSVGIIDNTYTGNIYVALTKVDPNAPELTLPWRCCQLVYRHQVHVDIEQCVEENNETAPVGRGEGGFGSTGMGK